MVPMVMRKAWMHLVDWLGSELRACEWWVGCN